MGRQHWAAVLLGSVVLLAAVAGWVAWRRIRALSSPEAMSFYQRGVDDIHAGAYFAATRLNEAVRITPRFALGHARLAEASIELEVQERAQEEMVRAQREDMTGLPKGTASNDRHFPHHYVRIPFGAAEIPAYRTSRAPRIGCLPRVGTRLHEAVTILPSSFHSRARGPLPTAPLAWLWLGILPRGSRNRSPRRLSMRPKSSPKR